MDNKEWTYQEIIECIEKAPAEVQAMVAKAFIREDIDNNNIQYTFNTDSFEELNEVGSVMENADTEEIEGIGAVGFAMRTTKPSNNKNFITTGSGGWNTCIKGYPNDARANVLANCVGYASGRFNEIINIARDTAKCTYKTLNCNAEGFVERAIAAGLKTGSTPKLGAIMCWQKGTLSSSDGAGHVAVVERVDNNNQVYTSESGYGSKAFWNQTRSNANGKWGIGNGYSFRCFIYLPDDVQAAIQNSAPEVAPAPKPVAPTKSIDEIAKEVIAGNWGNGDDRKNRLTAAGYDYNAIQNKVNELLKPSAPAPAPAPSNTLNVGDKVKIIGTGNGSSYGNSNVAGGIGWDRYILQIYEGRAYPYRVGDRATNVTTGFYQASALRKI